VVVSVTHPLSRSVTVCAPYRLSRSVMVCAPTICHGLGWSAPPPYITVPHGFAFESVTICNRVYPLPPVTAFEDLCPPSAVCHDLRWSFLFTVCHYLCGPDLYSIYFSTSLRSCFTKRNLIDAPKQSIQQKLTYSAFHISCSTMIQHLMMLLPVNVL